MIAKDFPMDDREARRALKERPASAGRASDIFPAFLQPQSPRLQL
jgi:hypothetical protein